ncbi:putative zinc metalloproteinase [Diplodia seriata]|uniref:Putative zinc metalloproteinase n=1 Tax=Diplodia seriata TaxID=420778 RepID=A0A0G2ET81_9PEZI|nr:putative zinc metalloproteinase [Diplodia seriata]
MASTAEHQAQPRETTISNNDIANTSPEAGADVAMSSPAATADNDAATSSTPPAAAAPAATAPPHGSSSSSSSSDAAEDNTLSITLTHHGTPYTLALPASATLTHLSAAVAATLSIPPAHQKFLITPKPGLVKPPFRDPAAPPLAPLVAARRKIVLMGSTAAEVSSLQQRVSQAAAQHAARSNRRYAVAAPATPARTAGRGVAGSARASEEVKYTFHALRPLAHLPRPERSLAFLERLRDDAGE